MFIRAIVAGAMAIALMACQQSSPTQPSPPGPNPGPGQQVRITDLMIRLADGTQLGAPLPAEVTMSHRLKITLVFNNPQSGQEIWGSLRVMQNGQVLEKSEGTTRPLAGINGVALTFQARSAGSFRVEGEVHEVTTGRSDQRDSSFEVVR